MIDFEREPLQLGQRHTYVFGLDDAALAAIMASMAEGGAVAAPAAAGAAGAGTAAAAAPTLAGSLATAAPAAAPMAPEVAGMGLDQAMSMGQMIPGMEQIPGNEILMPNQAAALTNPQEALSSAMGAAPATPPPSTPTPKPPKTEWEQMQERTRGAQQALRFASKFIDHKGSKNSLNLMAMAAGGVSNNDPEQAFKAMQGPLDDIAATMQENPPAQAPKLSPVAAPTMQPTQRPATALPPTSLMDPEKRMSAYRGGY